MEEKDYKKLYEDVVALAKDGLKDGLYLSQSAKAVTEFLFPQLKETEEEKARKGLVRFLINFNNGCYSKPSETEIDAWIKWINKKCEQKPVECIKFDNEFENQISHIIASVLNGEHEYNEGFVKYASQSLLGFANKEQNHTDKVEPKFKVGDIIKPKPYNEEHLIKDINENGYVLDVDIIIPFKDEDVWEIVKQKTTWSKEDENSGKKSEYVTEEKDMTEYKKGFECGKQRVLKYPEDFNLCKKHATWSEDDEAKLRDVIRLVEQGAPVRPISDHYTNWLKSLKDRFQLQPKQEWSEDDEHCIELLLPIIDSSSLIPKNRKKCKEFLKSLKYSHWKPSEKQLTALKNAIIGKRGPLYDLYFDLEKL